jgi:dephospho-CoA kinase
MFLPTSYHRFEAMFRELGYQQRTVDELGVRAWEEAAVESMPPDSVMFFKQLRQDRVLKPV